MKSANQGKNVSEKSQKTIADIAKLAGVSISTVSRVLNNSTEVSKSTKKKILKVIEEYDYMPSELARGLVTKTSKTIGLLIPDVFNSYYSELIQSIETVVSSRGFSLLLCITDAQKGKEEYYINEMLKRRANGLVMLSTNIENRNLIKKVQKSMEIVSVEADIEDVDRISVTNEEGTYDAINHLIS